MEPTRSERADAFTVLLYGVGAAVIVGIGTWLRAAGVFRDEFWAAIPVVAGGIAVGLIAVAFRRGIRLQK